MSSFVSGLLVSLIASAFFVHDLHSQDDSSPTRMLEGHFLTKLGVYQGIRRKRNAHSGEEFTPSYNNGDRLQSGRAIVPQRMARLYNDAFDDGDGGWTGPDAGDGESGGFTPADFRRLRAYMRSSDAVLTFFPRRITLLDADSYELQFGFSSHSADNGTNTPSTRTATVGEGIRFFDGLELVAAELHLLSRSANSTNEDPHQYTIRCSSNDGVSLASIGAGVFNLTQEMNLRLGSHTGEHKLRVYIDANRDGGAQWYCFGIAFFASSSPSSYDTLNEDESGGEREWTRRRKRSPGQNNISAGNHSNGCSLHALYVDFKTLNYWNEWIIAPPGYHADYCAGECGFPLAARLSPSNHAIVQSLVHSYDPTRAGDARCTPLATEAQRLLYFDDARNVVMRKVPAMRVVRCGCQ